jgi:hypothetical protein
MRRRLPALPKAASQRTETAANTTEANDSAAEQNPPGATRSTPLMRRHRSLSHAGSSILQRLRVSLPSKPSQSPPHRSTTRLAVLPDHKTKPYHSKRGIPGSRNMTELPTEPYQGLDKNNFAACRHLVHFMQQAPQGERRSTVLNKLATKNLVIQELGGRIFEIEQSIQKFNQQAPQHAKHLVSNDNFIPYVAAIYSELHEKSCAFEKNNPTTSLQEMETNQHLYSLSNRESQHAYPCAMQN